MRKIAALAVVAALAACGGSDSPPAPTTVTGNVGGTPFTQRDQAALFGQASSCSLAIAQGTPVSVSIAVADLADYAGVCTAATTCANHANSTSITLIIARASVLQPSTPPGFTPNQNYTFIDLAALGGGTPPTLPTTDPLPIFTAIVMKLGAQCQPTPVQVTGGTLKVTGSSGTSSIAGTVTLNLATGETLTGGFSASSCAGVPVFDACTALNGILGGSAPSFCGSQTPTCN
jgi:hypothetical protein